MNKDSNDKNSTATDLYTVLYAVADVIGFRYKGNRYVKGEVVRIDHKGILLKLKTDYIGKNEEWYEGELKYFNKREMKKVSKQ